VWVYRGKGTKYLQDGFDIEEPPPKNSSKWCSQVWVYRDPDYNWLHDTFEVKKLTNEEAVEPKFGSSTGLDAGGNKVQILE
jgi:hypothetical protein